MNLTKGIAIVLGLATVVVGQKIVARRSQKQREIEYEEKLNRLENAHRFRPDQEA